jgi:hypothetical protein
MLLFPVSIGFLTLLKRPGYTFNRARGLTGKAWKSLEG